MTKRSLIVARLVPGSEERVVEIFGQSDTTEYELGRLLDAERYLRLQPRLGVASEAMDDASDANMAALEAAAATMLADPDVDRRLTAFCTKLSPR